MNPPEKPRVAVGDTVHYVSYGTPNGEYLPECRAAIVTELDKNPEENENPAHEFVGLAILNPTGMFFNTCRLRDSTDFTGGSWHARDECPNNAAKDNDK